MTQALQHGHGYTVHRSPHTDHVRDLRCQFCAFSVSPSAHFKHGDKSGQGKYNRARGVMVKHLHAEHKDKLNGDAEQARTACSK